MTVTRVPESLGTLQWENHIGHYDRDRLLVGTGEQLSHCRHLSAGQLIQQASERVAGHVARGRGGNR